MALIDRIHADISRVFLNHGHFAQWHTWNGVKFQCVVDEETALKRKNNNVVDLGWDNNKTETMLYAPVDGFPGRAVPNEHVIFDLKPMKVLQVNEDMGMYTILLVSEDGRPIGTGDDIW